jgi:hypothetical protein
MILALLTLATSCRCWDIPQPSRRHAASEARARLGDTQAARSLIAEAEADEGYDPNAFFGWTRDVHERARAAVKAASATQRKRAAAAAHAR